VAEGRGNEIDKLEEEGKKKGLPPRLLEFYQKLLNIQSRTARQIGKIDPGLNKKIINERLESGRPLITFDELIIDWTLLNDTFAGVVAIFTDYSDLFGEFPENLKKSKPGPSLSKRVVKAWFKKSRLSSTVKIDNSNEHLLLEAAIHATFRPFLVSHAEALIGSVNQERWRRDYCPICGGKPDFAFLDSEVGARWLMCSRCDAKWLFQRLQCPYCGSENQSDLSYLSNEEGVYRLYLCEHCHKYIKAIDLRSTGPEVPLALERILTLDMDRQAQEKGYQPGHS